MYAQTKLYLEWRFNLVQVEALMSLQKKKANVNFSLGEKKTTYFFTRRHSYVD